MRHDKTAAPVKETPPSDRREEGGVTRFSFWVRVLGVMVGCYALPYLFQFVTVFLTGERLSWTEAYVRAGFLLIVLIHINTRPWKE